MAKTCTQSKKIYNQRKDAFWGMPLLKTLLISILRNIESDLLKDIAIKSITKLLCHYTAKVGSPRATGEIVEKYQNTKSINGEKRNDFHLLALRLVKKLYSLPFSSLQLNRTCVYASILRCIDILQDFVSSKNAIAL